MAQEVLREPDLNHSSARKRRRQRPYAVRKPKDYEVTESCFDLPELRSELLRGSGYIVPEGRISLWAT